MAGRGLRDLAGATEQGRLALEVGVVRRRVRRRPLRQDCPLRRAERHVERLRHLSRHVGLHLEHVRERRVEWLLPLGRAGRDLDQLRAHPDVAAARGLFPAHRAGEEIIHPELPADLLRALRRLLVLVRAAAGGDLEAGQRGELAAHLVGHAVREVLVVRAAQVLERQHREQLGAARTGRLAVPAEPAEQEPEAQDEAEGERGRGERETASSGDVSGSRLLRRNRRGGGRRDRGGHGDGTGPGGSQRRGELRRRREPVGRRARQRPLDRLLDRHRHRLARLPKRARRLHEPPGDRRLRGRCGERGLSCQHLVEHHPERVDVGARVQLLPARRLLGAHVGGRAHRHARSR